MHRILIDGRFIGVGESMTRYCLELVKGILAQDKQSQYTLLIRPQGWKTVQDWFNVETRMSKPEINPNGKNLGIKSLVRHSSFGFRNLTVDILDIPHYSISEQTKLLKYLNHEKFDLVHFIQFNHPVRYRGKYVVSIHDLTLLGHLHREPIHKRLAFARVMKSAVKNSAKIITISETSKKEIMEYYGVGADKIAVTYLAVDRGRYNSQVKDKTEKIGDFKVKYGIYGNYILYTGMWKKHKNLMRMLEAFEKVYPKYLIPSSSPIAGTTQPPGDAQPIQLVLVGKVDKNEPDLTKKINEINKLNSHPERSEGSSEHSEHYNEDSSFLQNDNEAMKPCNNDTSLDKSKIKPIVCTGYIEEADLPLVYAGALAYIIPSLSEGFGLPPLEAMACGTPVLSSDASAMPEILGDSALYFDPYDIDDMAAKMGEMVWDENLRGTLSEKAIAQAAKYSWHKTAGQTLEIYRELLS